MYNKKGLTRRCEWDSCWYHTNLTPTQLVFSASHIVCEGAWHHRVV